MPKYKCNFELFPIEIEVEANTIEEAEEKIQAEAECQVKWEICKQNSPVEVKEE